VTGFLDPSSYADKIDLHVAFNRTGKAADSVPALLETVAEWLLLDAGLAIESLPVGKHERRNLITRLLTLRPARPIPANALDQLDTLFADESARRASVGVVDVLAGSHQPVTMAGTRLQLWRGDITTLEVDAIVNAANADLLGCFRPSHACIDNAIHTAAGPRLREDCCRIMDIQRHREPTGTAKVTRAYYLPSRFVLHTVGPIISNGYVTAQQRESLSHSYEACLGLAAAVGAKSLAFCAISTGVGSRALTVAARALDVLEAVAETGV